MEKSFCTLSEVLGRTLETILLLVKWLNDEIAFLHMLVRKCYSKEVLMLGRLENYGPRAPFHLFRTDFTYAYASFIGIVTELLSYTSNDSCRSLSY